MLSSFTLNNASKTGFTFNGWYSEPTFKTLVTTFGPGKYGDVILYAKWTVKVYRISFNKNGGTGGNDYLDVRYGYGGDEGTKEWPTYINFPTITGYHCTGYYDSNGRVYFPARIGFGNYTWLDFPYTLTSGITLTARYAPNSYAVYIVARNMNTSMIKHILNPMSGTYPYSYDEYYEYVAPSIDGKVFKYWGSPDITLTDIYNKTLTIHNLTSSRQGIVNIDAYYDEDSCVAEGTMITLADGTQKAVEKLTGNEMLLVWNLKTGRFDSAPILFIDSDPLREYKVVNLYFSDGSEVKVITEHAFWDFNLNRYVYLREDAAQYVGHWFNKQLTDENGEFAWTSVQLVDVIVQYEYTTAWSPVTFGHLCYYVNGMLSMPGGITGLINIFEVDGDSLQYNEVTLLADIDEYGLFTYEEFAEIFPIPEIIFEAFDGQYLKVSIGKGLIDLETIGTLIERYSKFFG